MKCFFGLLFFWSTLSFAVVERRPLVEAAFRALPPMLNYVEGTKEFSKLPAEDQALFKKITDLTSQDQVELEFVDDEAIFRLPAGQAPRLMATTSVHTGKILVNHTLLRRHDVELGLALVFKTLFHEYGHKVGEPNQGLRDRLAQFFENQLASHVQTISLEDNAQVIFLSLPVNQLDRELVPNLMNRPQPSNLVLVRRQDVYTDLTDSILSQMEVSTAALRSMWTALNQGIYMVAELVMNAMKSVAPAVDQFFQMAEEITGQPVSKDENFFKSMDRRPKEISVLELHSANATEWGRDQWFVALRSTYSVTRTERQKIHFNMEGMWNDIYPVPMTIYLTLPKDPNDPKVGVHFALRPEADYRTGAEVRSVIRSNQSVASMKVRFPFAQAPRRAELMAHFGNGHLLLPGQEIREIKPGVVEVTFEVPSFLSSSGRPVAADAVLVDSEKMVFLQQMVSLTASASSPAVKDPDLALVGDSLGLWGLEKGKWTFKKNFAFNEPPLLFDGLDMPTFSLNPSTMVLEFLISRSERIREIRFHFRRMVTLLRDDEGKEQMSVRLVDGKLERLVNAGKMVGKKDLYEIVSIGAQQITVKPTSAGGPWRVQAQFRLPFKSFRALEHPREAHGPPFLTPISIEVVSEGFQTLNHNFTSEMPKNCVQLLAGESERKN